VATVLPTRDATRKAGSVGLPVVHTEVSIGDPEGRRCPPGEVGEIRVSGPQLMEGYWRDPEGTTGALHGGWLNTGDLGYLDDEGYLYVVDRLKDMLISGGLNVFPAEIERILAALPSIVDVAVVGVPEAPWGEVPAVVAYTGGAPLTGGDVLAVCAGSLADYKIPRYLVVTDEPLPRNVGGKIRKAELRARYADLPQRAAPIR
jgi:fatty-acyl-CoA synthase